MVHKLGMTGDVSMTFGERKQTLAIPDKYIKEKIGKNLYHYGKWKKRDIQVETGYEG